MDSIHLWMRGQLGAHRFAIDARGCPLQKHKIRTKGPNGRFDSIEERSLTYREVSSQNRGNFLGFSATGRKHEHRPLGMAYVVSGARNWECAEILIRICVEQSYCPSFGPFRCCAASDSRKFEFRTNGKTHDDWQRSWPNKKILIFLSASGCINLGAISECQDGLRETGEWRKLVENDGGVGVHCGPVSEVRSLRSLLTSPFKDSPRTRIEETSVKTMHLCRQRYFD
jgi:hypothetical protein